MKLRRGKKDRQSAVAAAKVASSAGAEAGTTATAAAAIAGAGTSMTDRKVQGGDDAGGSGGPPQDTARGTSGDENARHGKNLRPQDAPPHCRPTEESYDPEPVPPDAAEPDLTSVIPFALPLLPSKQAVRYFTTCKAWGQAGAEVLPSLVSQELRPVLPPRLASMLDRSERSREHWTEFGRQWYRRGFVRAKVGKGLDGDGDGKGQNFDKKEEGIKTKPDDSIDTDPPSCAACGESDGNLKRCTGCSSVWYCNKACQKAHRKTHKKECKTIADRFADEQEIKRAKAVEALDEKDLLSAFLSRPDIIDCLTEDTTPDDLDLFLYKLGCTSFYDLARGFGGGRSPSDPDDEDPDTDDEDGWGPNWNLLTERDGGHIRKDKFRYFVNELRRAAPGPDHYFLLEITGKGGRKLALEDGTPLAMWTDGLGNQSVGPVLSEFPHREQYQDVIDGLKPHAGKCSCPDCGAEAQIRIQYGDTTKVNSGLLLTDPILGDKMCGFEKDSYGRTKIKEGELPGLAFSKNTQEYREQIGMGACGDPDFVSLCGLFEVTLKLVHYGENPPSVVNVFNRDYLHLTNVEHLRESQGSMDSDEEEGGRNTGGLVLNFQNHRNGSCPTYHHSEFIDDDKPRLGIDINVKSVAGLFDLSECHFKCDPRPQTNELWLTHWSSFCFLVDYDPDTDSGTARRLPRSELFRACGLLSGFD